MKELKAFESWARDITESNLFEKGIPGGVQAAAHSAGDKTDRRLQQSDSILRQARRAFPGRDDSEAIALWTAGEVAKSREAELRQNKLINAQKRANEKLTRTVGEIGQEIDDFEKQSEQTDREVQRIKQLAGQTKAEVATRRVGRQEVEAMLNDLSKLKDRSDVSPEEYKKVRGEIDKLKGKTVDEEKFKEVQLGLEMGELQAGELNKLYDKVKAASGELDVKQASIEDFEKSTEKKLKNIADKQAREVEEVERNTLDIVDKQARDFAKLARNTLNIVDKQARGLKELEQIILTKEKDVDKYVKKAIDKATGRKGSYVQSKNRLDNIEPKVDAIYSVMPSLAKKMGALSSLLSKEKQFPLITQPPGEQPPEEDGYLAPRSPIVPSKDKATPDAKDSASPGLIKKVKTDDRTIHESLKKKPAHPEQSLDPFWIDVNDYLPRLKYDFIEDPRFKDIVDQVPQEEWTMILADTMARFFRDLYNQGLDLKFIKTRQDADKYILLPTAAKVRARLGKTYGLKGGPLSQYNPRVVTPIGIQKSASDKFKGARYSKDPEIAEAYNDEDPQYAKLYSMWGKAQDLDEHFWDLLRAELGAKDFQKVTHVLRNRGYTPEQLEGAYTKAMFRVLRSIDVPHARVVWKRMLADLQDETPDVATAQRKGDEAIAKARRLPPKLSDEVDNLAESILGSSYSKFLK